MSTFVKEIVYVSRFARTSICLAIHCKVKGLNHLEINRAAVFSNFIKVKNKLLEFPMTSNVVLDVSDCVLVDHSVIETLHHLKDDFETEGGHLVIMGIDEFIPISKHKLSVHRKRK